MARVKRQRPGLSYFGRKVETQEIRFDKNVFFEKQKSGSSSIVTTPATLFDGRQFREVKGRRVVSITDTDHTPLSSSTLFSAGIMPITPTSTRIIQLPTAADFITNALFEVFAAYEFTIVNLAGSITARVITNTDLTLTGNMEVLPNTSGTFTAVRVSDTQANIFRL
jgi:hypothetical protein